MLDFDLAVLYEVETRRLNEQVKRNIDKFPQDFMFKLAENEWEFIQSQIRNACIRTILFLCYLPIFHTYLRPIFHTYLRWELT